MGDIFKNGRFVADDWTTLAPDSDLPPAGRVFVPLQMWLARRDELMRRNEATGVLVEAGDDVAAIAPDLQRIAAIAVQFPKFSDGRGYSTARILREDLGYTGEIRAVGDVLIDQIGFMRRCGIDAFAVSHAPTRAALAAGETHEVALYYQPAGAGERPAGTRPWQRRPLQDTSEIEQA